MGERQREWPHEAQAQFALVVHALPSQAVPRRSQQRFLPWEGMQRGTPATPPNSRTGRVRASVRPPAPRCPVRKRTVSPIGHNAPRSQGPRGGETARSPVAAPCPPTVVVAGSGAGVSGCCGGGASSLGETIIYSPSSKSPLRPYARCLLQRVMFLAFVASGLVKPAIDVARGWPWRAFSGGEWRSTNGPRKRPLWRASAARRRD